MTALHGELTRVKDLRQQFCYNDVVHQASVAVQCPVRLSLYGVRILVSQQPILRCPDGRRRRESRKQ